MPESQEKKELGGLARSIDALFSQAPPVVEEQAEPDPFESLDPLPAEEPIAEEKSAPEEQSAFEGETTPEEAETDGPASADLERVVEVEPTRAEAPVSPAPAGPEDGGLAEAVDSFLAGEDGAAEEVESIARELQDRLALDPLADAVERLAQMGGGEPATAAVELALKVINPAVASRIVQRMGHEDDDERRADYVVLSRRLGPVMARAFRGALTASNEPRARRAFYDALIAMGPDSRPIIEEMMEDDNRFLVQNAVAILGEMGGDGAAELVTSALANTDYRVRREAVASLAKIGGEESGQLVLASLEDPDARVRAAAAEAAGQLGVERALRPTLALLEDEEEIEVVVPVLRGLGLLGDPGAVQAIEKKATGSLFSKPPTEVRVAAYRALHAIGTPHAREVIHKARDDKDPVVRTTARSLASEESA